jgi:hypothetical protein
MKSIQMPKALQPLLTFAEASEQDTLVFTEKRRPVAALVSLRNVDRESLALSLPAAAIAGQSMGPSSHPANGAMLQK